MNSVNLVGRLTRDPELRYTSGTQMAVCNMAIAIDRPVRQGGDRRPMKVYVVLVSEQRRMEVRHVFERKEKAERYLRLLGFDYDYDRSGWVSMKRHEFAEIVMREVR